MKAVWFFLYMAFYQNFANAVNVIDNICFHFIAFCVAVVNSRGDKSNFEQKWRVGLGSRFASKEGGSWITLKRLSALQ